MLVFLLNPNRVVGRLRLNTYRITKAKKQSQAQKKNPP